MRNKEFSCEYCPKTYKIEKNFIKHECAQKKRHNDMHTIKGKSAYMMYVQWMKYKHRLPPSHHTFIGSRYYNAFMGYIRFTKQMAIPNPSEYIRIMVGKNIDPFSWTKNEVHQFYLDNFDKNTLPLEQATITVNTFFQLSKIFDCELDEIFKYLDAHDLIKLIQVKKVSPWILLFSKQFFNFIIENTTLEQRTILETLINFTKWKKKFNKNPKIVIQMKNIVKELHI